MMVGKRISRVALALSLGLFAGCGGSSEPVQVAPQPSASAAVAPPASATQPEAKAPEAKPAPRADSTLIPRQVLFGNPDRAAPQLSPDGKQISFLAAVDGVLNIWVGPADDPSKAKPVTAEKTRGIRQYFWAYTNEHVLYVQDKGGDENWHVYAVDLKAQKTTDLTPFDGIAARIEDTSHKVPNEILVGLNDRDKKAHDLHRIDVKTGARTLVFKNEKGYAGFVTDGDFKVRLAQLQLPDGSMQLVDPSAKPKEKGKEPEPYMTIPFDDSETTTPVGFESTGKKLYLLDSRGRNTAALVEMDFATKKTKILLEDAKADVQRFAMHPKTGKVEAAAAIYDKVNWKPIEKSIQADLDLLSKLGDGELRLTSRALDDKRWLVGIAPSDGSVKYYRYDRDKKKTEFLFSMMKSLEGLPLAKMQSVEIKARDGLTLMSYLTVPKAADADGNGRPEKPVPMVLLVHGGPWARDTWGFSGMHQWLANRGYAVLAVNFRGSTGFGKNFINAANNEWAGKMHDDLIDAVKWSIDEKIADASKIAIMGGSYGGYSALVGLTFTPDTFACGVDIVGPSNLKTLLATIPPYWAPMIATFKARMGNPDTPEGSKLLDARSPLSLVDKIKKPLLIGQGANDPRVKQAESDQIVKAMQDKKIPVTYVLYPDEGHGFARPENRTSFNAVAETFLAQCLGGPYQPVGDDFKGSSISVPAGAADVHGLSEALSKK